MSVRIRLARYGAKKKPFYRVVIADIKSPRDGKFIESVGTYNPLMDPPEITLKNERINFWIGQGATPTDTVRSLLKKEASISEPS